jgi:putative transposase
MGRTIDMAIDKDMLDQLLAGRDPQDLFAKDGLLDELKKALSERMLSAELDDHLENEGAGGAINRRKGSSRKTVLTGTSKVTLDVPRDCAGTFKACQGRVSRRRKCRLRRLRSGEFEYKIRTPLIAQIF